MVEFVSAQAQLLRKMKEEIIIEKYENIRLKQEIDRLKNMLIEKTINNGNIEDLTKLVSQIY